MRQEDALATYRRAQLETATPHELVGRLYAVAIRACRLAARTLEEGDLEGAREPIHKAQDITTELIAALDFAAGGEIAQNLNQLYRYMHSRLVAAQVRKEAEAASEVADLLEQLAEAWVDMRPTARTEG